MNDVNNIKSNLKSLPSPEQSFTALFALLDQTFLCYGLCARLMFHAKTRFEGLRHYKKKTFVVYKAVKCVLAGKYVYISTKY